MGLRSRVPVRPKKTPPVGTFLDSELEEFYFLSPISSGRWFVDEPSCDLVPPSFWRCSCRRCCYPGSMHGVGVEDAAVRGTEDGADTPAQTGQMRMNSKPAPAPAAAPARHRYPPPSTPCLVRPTFGILGHLRTAQSCLASTNPLSLPDSTAPAPEGIAPGDSGPPRRLETLAPTPAFKITLADHHNATPLSFSLP